MYICPKCKRTYEQKYAFCEECGTRLELMQDQNLYRNAVVNEQENEEPATQVLNQEEYVGYQNENQDGRQNAYMQGGLQPDSSFSPDMQQQEAQGGWQNMNTGNRAVQGNWQNTGAGNTQVTGEWQNAGAGNTQVTGNWQNTGAGNAQGTNGWQNGFPKTTGMNNMNGMNGGHAPAKKSNTPVIVALVLLVVVILAGAAGAGTYFYYQNHKEETASKDKKDNKKKKADKSDKNTSAKKDKEDTSKEEEPKDYLTIADETLDFNNSSLDGYTTDMCQRADGSMGRVEWEIPDGILSRVIDDFDGNGEDECLVVELKSGSVYASMYEFEDDSMKQTDSILMGNDTGSMAKTYSVVYVNPMSKGINISYELWDSTTVEVCDGEDRIYNSFFYQNGKFVQQVNYGLSGSDWSDIEAPDVENGYLDTDDYYYSDMIYNWNKDRAVLLCEITGTIDASYLNYQTISRFVSQANNNKSKCGSRTYSDCVGDGKINLSKKVKSKATAAAKPSEQPDSPVAATASSDYIIPDSSSRYLSQSDLVGLTKEQLRIARNEIYAREGRMFQDAELQAYFNSKSWYVGSIPAESFQQSMLSDVERANTTLIAEYEKSLP